MTSMRLLFLCAPLALAACGEAPEPEPTPTATPTVAAPRTLVAADFDPATLGAKIVGPQGQEPEAAITADGREIARIKSFVACPEGVTECVPADMPEGTVYTYVHEVTLADDLEPQVIETPEAGGAVMEVPASLFRMTQAAQGFNRSVGYSRGQAETARAGRDRAWRGRRDPGQQRFGGNHLARDRRFGLEAGYAGDLLVAIDHPARRPGGRLQPRSQRCDRKREGTVPTRSGVASSLLDLPSSGEVRQNHADPTMARRIARADHAVRDRRAHGAADQGGARIQGVLPLP